MKTSGDVNDVLLTVLSTAGLVISGLGALCMGSMTVWAPLETYGQIDIQLWSALALGSVAVYGIPGLLTGILGLLNGSHPQAGKPSLWWMAALLSLPLAAGVHYLAYETGLIPSFLGLTGNMLTAFFGVVVSVQLVRRYSPPISRRRLWAQILTGLYAVPPLTLAVELAALLPIAALTALSVISHSLAPLPLEILMDPAYDPTQYLNQLMLEPFSDPGSTMLLLGYITLIVPIIEEILKTSALWFLFSRIKNSGEAFLAGALAGAGYGLFEALLMAQPGPGWIETGMLRIGATFLHTATAGLTSWGFFSAYRTGKWWRALGAYTAAVLFHSTWNFNAIMSSFQSTAPSGMNLTQKWLQLPAGTVPLLVFLLLSLISVGSLPLMARRSNRQDHHEATSS